MLSKKITLTAIIVVPFLVIGSLLYLNLNSKQTLAQTTGDCSFSGGTLVFTDPQNCPTKSGSINFTVTDPTFPQSVKFRLAAHMIGDCRTLFTESKNAAVHTTQSWNTTEVSDGVYWIIAEATYTGPQPPFIPVSTAGAKFTINNGYTGTACQTPDRPTVDIQANDSNGPITIAYNTSAFIKWNSTNASGCTVLPSGWTGKSGGQSSGNLQSSQTYTVNCFGPGGNVDDSVTVNVSSQSGSSGSSGSTNPSSGSTTNNSTNKTNTTTGETVTSPETVTSETLASADKLIIEEEIPVSITEFDPDIFLKGNNIKLNSIKNIKKDKKSYIYFEGKTKPNTLVTLYIFSNPIIVTLKSDSNGNWNYERDKRIETGKHSAFATIYDEGVTRRSDVTSFFVAKNSSGNLVLKQTAFDNLLFYGIIIGVVITFSIIILIMYRIYLSKKVKTS